MPASPELLAESMELLLPEFAGLAESAEEEGCHSRAATEPANARWGLTAFRSSRAASLNFGNREKPAKAD